MMMTVRELLVLSLCFGFCLSQAFGFGRWPGTKWCGIGNDATDYDDLADGIHRPTDSCCRAHDHCDKLIGPFQFKYSIFNWNLFTMVECRCDKEFYECLKALGEDPVANGVGVFYFNKLARKCFNDPSTNLSGKQQQQKVPSWTSEQRSDELIG